MQKFNISHEYSVDLWDEGVCDRKNLDIGWIYACLNPIRQKVERKLNLTQTNFQLSPYYILYFDLLEKSESFLDRIIRTAHQPVTYASVQSLLDSPISLDGNWFTFASIVKKHGLVPFHAMLGTGFHAHKTDVMTVLKNRLLYGANAIRQSEDALFEKIKEDALNDIKDILTEQFGTPPETFNWNYNDRNGHPNRFENISPQEFFENCCETDLNAYRIVFDERIRLFKNKNAVAVNVGQLKMLCSKQLESGEQVVICADARQQANQMLGILDTDFNDNESVYGKDLYMSKADSFRFKRILPVSFLSLDGVHIEDGVPVRFKAQDSAGALTGADGHYTMNEKWFDEYVFYAVINNSFLSD